jgi:hypothetical protein
MVLLSYSVQTHIVKALRLLRGRVCLQNQVLVCKHWRTLFFSLSSDVGNSGCVHRSVEKRSFHVIFETMGLVFAGVQAAGVLQLEERA